MRQRSLMAVVCLGLVLAGGAVAWRMSDRRVQLHERLTEWEELQQVEARLDQPVEIKLGKRVDLKTWLAEFTRQTGLQFIMHGPPEYYAPANRSIELELARQPIRRALDQFGQPSQCSWRPEGATTIGLYPYDLVSFPPTIRTYSLDQSLSPLMQRQIAEALQSVIAPDSWSDVGGPGELIASPGQLVIAQHYELHPRIREFLTRFQRELRRSAELPAVGISADDPRLQSAALTSEANPFERTHAAFNERVSVDFVDQPLKDCLAQLSEMIDVPIVIPMRVERDIYLDQVVTLRVVDVRLSTALELLLHPQGAFVVPTIDGAALKVVTVDQEQSPENMLWRAYPVPDFPSTGRPQLDPLAELLMLTVDMDSWKDVGGPGSVQRIGNLLLVSQSNRTHQRIPEILHALRIVRSGKQPFANIRRPSADREQILQKLQQPLALKYNDVTLQELVADLAERGDFSVVLLKWIEDTGLTADSRIKCDLPERPLEENLYALLRRYNLNFEVREDCLAITSVADVNRPDNMETEVVDVRALRQQIGTADLIAILTSAVEPDNWSDVGGPGMIKEFEGLLIVQNRPELLAQVRHVLSVLESQLLHRGGQMNRGNLLTRSPQDSLPNTPLIHLYEVADLLHPRGRIPQQDLVATLNIVYGPHFDPGMDHANVQIFGKRFLVAYMQPEFVEPLEAMLRELRKK